METINKKDIIVNYLKMCNKNDMVNAVIKYCDEDCGIVFNKHPARDEKTFENIIDYSVDVIDEMSNSNTTNNTTKESIKYLSSIMQSLGSFKMILDGSLEDTNKQSITMSNNSNKTENGERAKLDDIKNKVGNKNNSNNNNSNNNNSNNNNSNKIKVENKSYIHYDENDDGTFEIITPEGRGTFLKFIGNNYVYILLENGTYNCYPADLIRLSYAYFKKNTVCSLKYNNKDVALNHTRNLLKNKRNILYKDDKLLNNNNKIKNNEFVNFIGNMSYLKKYLIKNDITNDDSYEQDYLIHKYVNRAHVGNNTNNYYLSSDNNPINKKIMVNTLNNIYKIENTKQYIPVNDNLTNNEHCNTCC